jgi:hypothetical protein
VLQPASNGAMNESSATVARKVRAERNMAGLPGKEVPHDRDRTSGRDMRQMT